MDELSIKRVACWLNTQKICSSMALPPKASKIRYNDNFVYEKKYEKSNIKLYDMDSIDCCLTHASQALVLNLSDDLYAGGCVDIGSGAQEESLFRRTNYFQSLTQDFYPIRNNEAVYSPQISVIKSGEPTNWQPIENPSTISFIACPAIKYPTKIVVDGEKQLKPEDALRLKVKIELIIQAAVRFKHDTIIFGAMGCGAWRNPAKHVAQIFKMVLDEYDGVIENYYFAILSTVGDGESKKDKNIDIFKEVFGT